MIQTPINIKELQETLKSSLSELLAQDGPTGNFKKIAKLSGVYSHLALAYVYSPANSAEGLVSQKKMLEVEKKSLELLKQRGFSAIEVYGEIFELEHNRFAMIVDYIEDAHLIDMKEVNIAIDAVKGYITQIHIPSHQEAYYMHKEAIENKIKKQIEDCSLVFFKERALNLLDRLNDLIKKMSDQHIQIVDLQLLVDKNEQLHIIDPLTICSTENLHSYDIFNSSEPLDEDFFQRLSATSRILAKIQSLLYGIAYCDSKNALIQILVPSFEAQCDKKSKGHSSSNSLLKQLMQKKMHTVRINAVVEEFKAPLNQQKSFVRKIL